MVARSQPSVKHTPTSPTDAERIVALAWHLSQAHTRTTGRHLPYHDALAQARRMVVGGGAK